ncbi:MAG: hypothetical protein KJO23_08705, partial [Bacteroidia bacterium]|nr:hypothetical protein [Bacteroidia bacterium]
GAGTYSWVDDAGGGADTNLGDTNLTQTAGQDRTYNLNNQNLAFTGNGNIGIGTSGNPQAKLHVEGLTRTEGIHNSDGLVSEPSYRFTSDTDTGMFRAGSDQLAFSTGNSEAVRISNTRTTINGELELNQELIDVNNQAGTAGQILSSTGTGVDWIDAPSGGAVQANNPISGDGTAPSPLGITPLGIISALIGNQAVTEEKINPGSNGDVLTTTGGNVVWAPPPSTSPVIAMGKVDATATSERINSEVTAVNNTGTGTYQVFLLNSRPTNDYIIQLSLLSAGAGYTIEVLTQSNNSFTVNIYDATDSLANAEWYFTVLDF